MKFSKNSIRKALRYRVLPTSLNELDTKRFKALIEVLSNKNRRLKKEQFLTLIDFNDYNTTVSESGKSVVYKVSIENYGDYKFYSKRFLEI